MPPAVGLPTQKWCSPQDSNLPFRLTKAVSCRMNERSAIGARSIELNVHFSRYKPEALPVELCGHARAGLARFALSNLVLAAGVEPATSRLRSACTAVVLRQQSFIPPRRKPAPVGLYRPRERRMQRGAQPENFFNHASALARALLRALANLTHAHPFGRERAQDSDCGL